LFAYAARRIIYTIPLLIIGTFIVFFLVSIAGDPLAKFATCTTCDQSAYDRIIDLYDLDEPIPQRYLSWLGGALTGDLGTSPRFGDQPVAEILPERIKNSALIAVPAMLFILVFSVVLGVFSAVRQYSFGDHLFTGLSFIGIAMPVFVTALLLQIFWGVWWPEWTGTKPFFIAGMHTGSPLELLQSLVLPITALVLVILAAESRYQRASMLEVLNSDYVRTARAKGVPKRTVIYHHALRNALIPMVTIWALDFAFLLGGSVVTETVFAWPGLGPMLYDGIFAQDVDLVMAIVMFFAVLVIIFNLVADLLYGVLDPRIRLD
jgi:peptide/nickel transport system permease protein